MIIKSACKRSCSLITSVNNTPAHTHTHTQGGPQKSPWRLLYTQCIPAAHCTELLHKLTYNRVTTESKGTFPHFQPRPEGKPAKPSANSLRYLQCPLVTAVSASLPVTHRLTFSLPSLTQHFPLNVKWLCCWWRPVGVRSICQGSVQYPLNRNLKPEKPEAINPNSLDSSESETDCLL